MIKGMAVKRVKKVIQSNREDLESQSKKAEYRKCPFIIYVSPVWGAPYDDAIKTLLFIHCEIAQHLFGIYG